jgi:iron complex outermembrane receptor protein
MDRENSLNLRTCIASVLLAAASHAVTAAEPAAETPDAVLMQEVVITGSYLEGTPADAALPVTVINEDQLDARGSPALLDVLRSLSESQGTIGDSNAQAILDGGSATSVNLRGLDAGRTLVLFNGRRLPTSPVTLLGVDANLLPLSAVGRIEVLKDGAAATYGSDAIAGVVNFISKSGFDGLQIEGSYTAIEDSDGDYETNLVWGRNAETFDLLFSAGYRHRSELKARDRSFALPPFDPNNLSQGGVGANGNPGAFIIPPVTGAPNIFVDPGCANLSGGPRMVMGQPPQCPFQQAQFQNLVERGEEYHAYAEFNTKLSSNVVLHLDAFYAAHDTPEENSGPSNTVTQGPGASVQQRLGLPVDPMNAPNFFVPLTNPGLQALLPSLPAAQVAAIQQAGGVVSNGLLSRPIGVGGNPLFENEGAQRERLFDAFRVSSSLSGALGEIGWEVALTYGENKRTVRTPQTLPANMQLALVGLGGANCNGTTPGQNGCLFFNPFSSGLARNVVTGQVNPLSGTGGTFDPTTVNSFEVVDFISDLRVFDETTDVLVADLIFDGQAGIELPGGDIGWAVGAQYREDGFEREVNGLANLNQFPCADSIINPAATCVNSVGPFDFQNGLLPQTFDSDVYGLFGELSLPLLQSVQAQLAFRYEDYGGVTGSTSNPKLALRWQATEWLTVRGSASSTFRGPFLLQQANTPIVGNFFVSQLGAVRPFDNFGNPNVQPEEADNYNVGFLVNTERLSISLDYFNIRLEDKIVTEFGPDVVTAFFGAPTSRVNNCGRAGFEALQARFMFQNNVCGLQNVVRVRANTINGPDEDIRGMDFGAAYRFDDVAGGTLRLAVNGTYNLEYNRERFFIENVELPNLGNRDFVGTRGGIQALPELRGAASAEYVRGRQSFRLSGNYVDGVTDLQDGARNTDGTLDEIPSYFSTDFVYRYKMPSNLTFTAAVFNVADRDPPAVRQVDFSYDPQFYNPIGRAFKVEMQKRFD